MENNSKELAELNKNLDTDYLTRAKAAAYVMDHQKEVSLNVKEMQYLAKLLNVDEIHVIDENGYIVSGSVSKYIGINMDDHKQTKEFLSLLDNDNDDEDAYLIQDPQPNAAENKIMQYVGVVLNRSGSWRHSREILTNIFFQNSPLMSVRNFLLLTVIQESSLDTRMVWTGILKRTIISWRNCRSVRMVHLKKGKMAV